MSYWVSTAVEAEVKTIVSDWVLITYDIPQSAAKLRRTFIKEAKALGAEKHTASVYYMPYSDEAMDLANKLESAGYAVVWRSYQPDQAKAIVLTINYADKLKVRCDTIEQRLSMAETYITQGKLKVAARLGIKSFKLMQQLNDISKSFNPPWLKAKLDELAAKWGQIYGVKEE
jgi:hypothetical protein